VRKKKKKKIMVVLVSRTGRHLQRYNKGRRLIVGCIPYRYRVTPLGDEEKLEVLVISSQKEGKGVFFPKGGWESDESLQEAALRETEEEAGVLGNLEHSLGKWYFKSKNKDTFYEGRMFPLLVEEQLEFWPEKDVRQRFWMSVTEARESCHYLWMKDALDVFVSRLGSTKRKIEEAEIVGPCKL
jgi:diphosphoinositol-polyphosphate diphosphatase